MFCPIARAIRQQTGWSPWVQLTRIKFGNRVHPLPKRACAFIRAFDAGKRVKPFAFRLYSIRRKKVSK